MRIRQVRPEFWTDPVVAVLGDPVRLFYIGLWNVADDAGWFDWQPEQIGALLYPYRSATVRNRQITDWAEKLQATGRLLIHDCGCAVIPTLPKHQRVTGKQSFTTRDKHAANHVRRTFDAPIAPNGSQVLTDSPVTEGRGREGNVTDESNSTTEEWRSLRPKLKAVAVAS